jgi:putative DNA primase/helicase
LSEASVRSVGVPQAWDPEVIDQAIPELPRAVPNRNETTGKPPVELGTEALKVWRGESAKVKDTGEIDRSGSLVKVGRVLYDAGATRPTIVAALAERDEALGWHKYTGRQDADQRYNEIVDELESNGRNTRARLTFRSNGHGKARPPSFNLTDLGNAARLVHRHGRNLRYCWLWRKWLVWDGKRWVKDDTGEIYRLAKESVASIYKEAAGAPDDEERKALAKHAMRSEAGARIKEMVDLARSDVPVVPDELDASPDLLNTESGTIELQTGELREHRREDLITKLAPVEYRPDAPAPAWDAFLERVLPGEELRGFVRRASGYSATGDTSEQCMFINHGGGANGKSTFQEAIAAALGEYAMRAPTEMLLAKRSGGIPNDIARLKGSRFVASSETEEGRRLAESLIKDLTGQDTVTARFLWAELFEFTPTHKLWLSTNHKPEIRGTDNAIWRRIRLIPWSVTIPPAEQDKKLPAALRRELAGILAWIVRGCLEWRREGLQAPDEVRRATGQYRAEMDVLAGFLAECCELDTGHWEYAKDLYECYKRWCDENGERPEPQRKFGGRLGERGFHRDRGGSRGAGIWRGVRLTEGEKEVLGEC